MRWTFASEEPQGTGGAGVLADQLGLHPLVAEILCQRGLGDRDRAHEFLSGALSDLPDPSLFRDMDRAVARICEAVARRERIVAYGDYDVDGVTATVQLVDFLKGLGADVGWYIPHRLTEGYGLNPGAVERLAAQGTKLIVTLDCGVT